MDIAAISSVPLTTSQPLEPRASRATQQQSRGEAAQAVRQAREDAANESARASAEALQTSRDQPARQAAPLSSGGSIEFEHDEGTRVMKVLDSKDVLIYQVPPKGELTLIRAAETEARQALASA